MNRIKRALCTLSILHATATHTAPLLTFRLLPFEQKDRAKRVAKRLKKPGGAAHYVLNHQIEKQPVSGVFISYAGYLAVSRSDGQVVFPLAHSEKKIPLIVTPQITPVVAAGINVEHWKVAPETIAAYYMIEQKIDPETGLTFWHPRQTAEPVDRSIPPEALIIIAKPKNVHVPSAIKIVEKHSPHFSIPDIYIKKGIDLVKNSLQMILISQFFRPVKLKHKREEARDMLHVKTR